MLPHAEIVVGAPDSDLASETMIKGAGKSAATPFKVGEAPVTALGTKRIKPLFEEAFVVDLETSCLWSLAAR